MTKTCRTCKRQLATEADWKAFAQIEECGLSNCPWGADRCWYEDGKECTFPDGPEMQALAQQGAQLRNRRTLSRVPHRCSPAGA